MVVKYKKAGSCHMNNIFMRVRLSAVLLITITTLGLASDRESQKPNVILILTDDQGFGDLGYYGNPHIKTPVIDGLAEESVRFDEFLVSPACTPTRAALLTGRYYLRTGVYSTTNGGSIMASSEITIAEVLKNAGYKTGMVGKWHLGDNYPTRAMDQGFDYTLNHLAGAIGLAGDWPNALKEDSSYFDPNLWQNGELVKTKGYCSDVFTDAAIQFVEKNREHPFFLYLAFNAPHTPLQVPNKYYEMYKDIDPAKGFENDSRPFPKMNEKSKEETRKVYAMVSNIDDNVGRLLKKLHNLNLEDNTLVIFMTDNGPYPFRYLAGMRGRKSFVYQGGVRVPSFWRLPGTFKGNRDIKTPASHYDILPTLADLCGGEIPSDRKIDGRTLLPLLKNNKSDLPERSDIRVWRKGSKFPEKYTNIAIRKGDYKLVGNCEEMDGVDQFELFDIVKDPFELDNVVLSHKSNATALKTELDHWLADMLAEPNIANPPHVIIGTPYENPSVLNANNGIAEREQGSKKKLYLYWKVENFKSGEYDISVHFKEKITTDCSVEIKFDNVKRVVGFKKPQSDVLKIDNIYLPASKADLIVKVKVGNNNEMKIQLPFYVEISNENILGFSHIYKSGAGCSDFPDTLFLPLDPSAKTDNVNELRRSQFATPFSYKRL